MVNSPGSGPTRFTLHHWIPADDAPYHGGAGKRPNDSISSQPSPKCKVSVSPYAITGPIFVFPYRSLYQSFSLHQTKLPNALLPTMARTITQPDVLKFRPCRWCADCRRMALSHPQNPSAIPTGSCNTSYIIPYTCGKGRCGRMWCYLGIPKRKQKGR